MTAKDIKEKRKPGVCFLSESYYPVIGGTETQTRLMAADLVKAGFPVVTITRRTLPETPRMEEKDGYTLYRLPPDGGGANEEVVVFFALYSCTYSRTKAL